MTAERLRARLPRRGHPLDPETVGMPPDDDAEGRPGPLVALEVGPLSLVERFPIWRIFDCA